MANRSTSLDESTMTVPTDIDSLEPGLRTLLSLITARPPAPSPNTAMVALAEELSSPALAAYARALGSHLWMVDFGRFEADAEDLRDNGCFDEILEALEPLGLAEAEGLCIGNSGGGEEALLMLTDAASSAGYQIFRFAYDGTPYANGRAIQPLGLVGDMLQHLAAEQSLDPDLQRVLAEIGVEPPAEALVHEPPGPPDVLQLRPVTPPPVVLSAEERNRRFAGTYEDTRLRDAVTVDFLTRRGRVGARLVGNLLGSYRNEVLLSNPDGTVALHITSPTWRWVCGHPEGERALIFDGDDAFEMDLSTQQRQRIGPKPAKLAYLLSSGRERLISVDQSDMMIRVWSHEPLQPLPAEPLAELELGDQAWYAFAPFGLDGFIRPVPEDPTRRQLVRVVETDDAVRFEVGPTLELPGDVPATGLWSTRVVDDIPYVVVQKTWFTI